MLDGLVDIKVELGHSAQGLPLCVARVPDGVVDIGFVQHNLNIVGIHNGLARWKGKVVRNGQTLVVPANAALLEAADGCGARKVDGG